MQVYRHRGHNWKTNPRLAHRVPYRNHHTPTENERQLWNSHREEYHAMARNGVDVKEALTYVHHPNWRWNAET